MQNGKPVFGQECAICLGCVYGCPKKAIDVSGVCKSLVIKEGFDIKALEQYANELPADIPVSSTAAKGYLYSGVRKYLNDK